MANIHVRIPFPHTAPPLRESVQPVTFDPLSNLFGVAVFVQCGIFPGMSPEAESNPATLRIKYGIHPGISGICPIPAAESKVGYIPLFGHATVASSRGARAPLAKRGRSPWPGRRLGAFAQRGRAHCTSWASCREQFGLLFAQSVRRIVPQRMLDVRRGGCWHHG